MTPFQNQFYCPHFHLSSIHLYAFDFHFSSCFLISSPFYFLIKFSFSDEYLNYIFPIVSKLP